MKLKSLKIFGFKSLKEIDWELGGLSVVIGPNGSGKSNLVSALKIFSETDFERLRKSVVAFGGVSSISWDGRASGIEFATVITLDQENYSRRWTRAVKVRWLVDGDIGVSSFNSDTFDNANSQYDTQSNDEHFINGWLILDDFHTDRNAEVRRDTVSRVEHQLDPDGQNLVAVLHTHYTNNREFKRVINDAMTAAFGDEFEELVFAPSADQRIQLRVRWKSLKRTYSTANLSDGTLRFLFLITALSQPDPPTLIAIDEPETGLHPSMMKIVAEHAANAALKTQVIITTHSAQFLDAIGQHKPTVTVCELHEGETKLRVLNGDELDYWLTKYSLGELQRSGQLDIIAETEDEIAEAVI